MEEKLKWDDIPVVLQNRILEIFNNNSSIKKLRAQYKRLNAEKKYIQAASIQNIIAQKWEVAKQTILDEEYNEAKKSNDFFSNVDSKEYIGELLATIFLSSDILESALMDLDSELKRVNKPKWVTLNELMTLYKNVRIKMGYMTRLCEFLQDETWGEEADKAGVLLRNKAKSIVTKIDKKRANNT